VAHRRSTAPPREHRWLAQEPPDASLPDQLERFQSRTSRRYHTDEEQSLSIPELRALADLESDLLWDDLERHRVACDIAVATALGYAGVARRLLLVCAGFVAVALAATGQLDVLDVVRGLR
jgi:hypothetical protein